MTNFLLLVASSLVFAACGDGDAERKAAITKLEADIDYVALGVDVVYSAVRNTANPLPLKRSTVDRVKSLRTALSARSAMSTVIAWPDVPELAACQKQWTSGTSEIAAELAATEAETKDDIAKLTASTATADRLGVVWALASAWNPHEVSLARKVCAFTSTARLCADALAALKSSPRKLAALTTMRCTP